jgi:carbonic anhydrase/acetyltransferase-like protein (isoleucine patch superfamily)
MNHGSVHSLGERHLETADEQYYIAPGAQVIGSVRLGTEASLWFNCVLRGDDEWIEIGAGSNVQDGVVIHADAGFPTRVGRNVTIGHLALLHGCTVADDTLIGNGALVLDRAHIGRHCVIGAGALVPPGAQIPDDSVVMGMPGKVVRQVSADDLAMIEAGGAHYRARLQRYRNCLRASAAP